MTQIEANTYVTLIRADYLYGLGKVCKDRDERNRLIAIAIREFLDLPPEDRKAIITQEALGKRPGLRDDQKYHHWHYLEVLKIDDGLVLSLEISKPTFLSTKKKLNAAIKRYLEIHHPNFIDDPEPEEELVASIRIPTHTMSELNKIPSNMRRAYVERIIADKLMVEAIKEAAGERTEG